MTKLLPLATLLFASTTLRAEAPTNPATASLGDWRTPIGAIVRIEPCGNATCLRIVKLSSNPPETVDGHNPDTILRNRPLCNLVIGSGFTPSDEKRLGNGHLYDPISGHTYRGYITPAGNQLKLRGYVLFTIFGRTETWQRVPVTPSSCH
jgi:uncharacterized protein (DUF2147 family)